MRTTSLLAPRLAALAVALLTAGAATADTQSLQGLFSRDDERAVFSFTLRQPDRLLARTLSYGGGLNAAGQPVACCSRRSAATTPARARCSAGTPRWTCRWVPASTRWC
jgi:hypothetical protein